MDIPNYKDLIQKLSFLKNYTSLLLPVVIVLAALFLFVPIQLMSSNLKNRVTKESISKIGKQIQSLTSDSVAVDQWKQEEVYQQAHERDANQIALLSLQSTQRQLLSYKIFPEPKDVSALIFREFGQRFCESVDELITRMNGRDCPTNAELERSIRSSGVSRSGRGGQSVSVRLGEVDATILDVLCRAKAESASVYVSPFDLSGYGYWIDYKYAGENQAVEDCWYYQLGYWLIEDVIETIAALNSGSNSVYKSPVKRLSEIRFTGVDISSSESRVKMVETGDRPRYVLSDTDGLTRSYTGRVCDENVDVVHFRVSVVVSTKSVLSFMQQLCGAKQHKFSGFFGDEPERIFKHNQITILESQISSVDRGDVAHNLYRYGEDAVVQLNLICEYIFNSKGYEEIKPASVKGLTEQPEKEEPVKVRSKRSRSSQKKTSEQDTSSDF